MTTLSYFANHFFLAKHKCLIFVLLLSLLVPLIILGTSGEHGRQGFPLDDAWIHLVYGRTVAEDGYLAYNRGIPSTGSTSPLWAYLLGAVHVLLKKANLIIWGAKFLGILLHFVTTYLSYRLLIFLTNSKPASLLVALLVGLCPPLVTSSFSGMEIPLATATFLGGAYAFVRQGWILSGIFLGLSGLTRPEFAPAIAIFLLGLLGRVLKEKSSPLKLIAFLLPIASMAVLNLGWNLLVDGRPFPATFYVKASLGAGPGLLERLVIGSYMISRYAFAPGALIWAGLLFFPLTKPKEKKASLLFYALSFAYFSGSLITMPPRDPAAYYYIRYLLPAIPPACLGASIPLVFGGQALWRKILEKKKLHSPLDRYIAYGTGGLIVIFLCLLTGYGLFFWKQKYSRDCRNINEVQVELGKAISRSFPEDAKIGTVDAGAIRYFGKRMTLDLMGLNTKNVFDCHDENAYLEALVLMPAWVRLPSGHNLEVILVKKTADYQVSSDPLMGRQFIAVCHGKLGQLSQALDFQIIDRHLRVCLRCYDAAGIQLLRRSIGP